MAYKDFTDMPALWNNYCKTIIASHFTGPVWQKAFKLLLKVYEVTKAYPKEEKYGLVSDMRRAANSVTNNISEGFVSDLKYHPHFHVILTAGGLSISKNKWIDSPGEYLLPEKGLKKPVIAETRIISCTEKWW